MCDNFLVGIYSITIINFAIYLFCCWLNPYSVVTFALPVECMLLMFSSLWGEYEIIKMWTAHIAVIMTASGLYNNHSRSVITAFMCLHTRYKDPHTHNYDTTYSSQTKSALQYCWVWFAFLWPTTPQASVDLRARCFLDDVRILVCPMKLQNVTRGLANNITYTIHTHQ